MSDICEVTIDGTDYYCECARVSDLSFIDGYLVNFSNSSLTLRSGFSYNNTVYPNITCSSMSVCSIRRTQNSSSQAVTSDYSYNGDLLLTANYPYLIFILLFILLGVRLFWKH